MEGVLEPYVSEANIMVKDKVYICYEATSMSVNRACDWLVTAPPRAVHVSKYEAAPMSVKRAWDWSVNATRHAVLVSEARMGLVNGRGVLPSRSRNSCPRCRAQTTIQNCIGSDANVLSDYKKTCLQKNL